MSSSRISAPTQNHPHPDHPGSFRALVLCIFGMILAAGTATPGACQTGTMLDDRDGQSYRWVQIGDQMWMAENLNFPIPSNSWCPGDRETACEEFGRLYDWTGAGGACPQGWHLASDEEWAIMETTLGEGSVRKLLERGSSGFEAKLSGHHGYARQQVGLGESTQFWTATPRPDSQDHSYARYLHLDRANLVRTAIGFTAGLSIRCIRDGS